MAATTRVKQRCKLAPKGDTVENANRMPAILRNFRRYATHCIERMFNG